MVGLSTFHISPFEEKKQSISLSEYYNSRNAMLTETEKAYVSMADGLIANRGGVFHYESEEAYAELALGGSLVIVKPERPKGGDPMGPGAGRERGAVLGFSSGSRRRLMRMIAGIERKERPVFVTLTYPDVFDDDMLKWKRDIDVLGKRLARKVPDAGFVWRIEFKKRKSGLGEGKVAPHFHLLVYRASYSELRIIIPSMWHEVVGSQNNDHLRAGSRVERIYSYGGIMRYVGKYVSKLGEFPLEWSGRAWGVIGRKNIPWAIRVFIPLTEREGVRLVRLGRKMVGLKGKTLTFGLTWIMNAERVLDYLEVMGGVL